MKRTGCICTGIGICLIAVVLCIPAAMADSGVQLTIIANKSVSGATFSAEEIRNIFLGHKIRWDDNTQILLACLKEDDAHRQFVHTYTRRTPSQFQAWWRQMLFTGKGAMPKFFDTEQQTIEFVERTPGAIGYVKARPDSPNVNIITVTQ